MDQLVELSKQCRSTKEFFSKLWENIKIVIDERNDMHLEADLGAESIILPPLPNHFDENYLRALVSNKNHVACFYKERVFIFDKTQFSDHISYIFEQFRDVKLLEILLNLVLNGGTEADYKLLEEYGLYIIADDGKINININGNALIYASRPHIYKYFLDQKDNMTAETLLECQNRYLFLWPDCPVGPDHLEKFIYAKDLHQLIPTDDIQGYIYENRHRLTSEGLNFCRQIFGLLWPQEKEGPQETITKEILVDIMENKNNYYRRHVIDKKGWDEYGLKHYNCQNVVCSYLLQDIYLGGYKLEPEAAEYVSTLDPGLWQVFTADQTIVAKWLEGLKITSIRQYESLKDLDPLKLKEEYVDYCRAAMNR